MTTISEIYELVNSFRENPYLYNSSCPCHPEPNLTVNALLEKAAQFQVMNRCYPISHKTCPEYCAQFGSCNFLDRVKSFTHGTSTHEYEILVYGPRQPFQATLNSHGHCEIMRRIDINSMGGFIFDHLYILLVAYITTR